uniref:Solute carrier family 22 member 13a n=1 Tax=Amphilophus citrinellus TaxID=61819 RepID=A0A3Q0RM86_AMPCI
MVDFGEILRDIGEFGLFQKITLIALCFPNFVQAFILASFIFIQSDPERHCNTDWILNAAPNLTTEEQLNLTVPREEDGTFSRCQMFVPVDWDIDTIRDYGLNETTGCQHGWVYGNMLYAATIVTDVSEICDSADQFGRKRATQIPAVLVFVFALTTALCPNVYLYLVSLFLMGFGAGGYRVNSIILGMKSTLTLYIFWTSAIGQCVLAGMIYGIRHWRLAQLISAVPLTFLIIYIWFIPESARWLLSRGRKEEAKQLIVKAAAINKRPVSESLLAEVLNHIYQGKVFNMFGIILCWHRFSLNLSIYSMYLDMENFGLNIFLTQVLFGAFEIPSVLLSMWLLEIFGRKILFIATLLIGGVASMLILAVPEGKSVLFPTSSTFLPSCFRPTATALGSISARLGSLLAPLLNMLAMYHSAIPIVVFSCLTLLGGALGFLLPETKRRELPETAEEAESNGYLCSTFTASLTFQFAKDSFFICFCFVSFRYVGSTTTKTKSPYSTKM